MSFGSFTHRCGLVLLLLGLPEMSEAASGILVGRPSSSLGYISSGEQIVVGPWGFRIEPPGAIATQVSFEGAEERPPRQTNDRGIVEYREIWPGVALRYRPEKHGIEYYFVLDPGADPARVQLRVETGTLRLSDAGELLTGNGVALTRPRAWQNQGRRRRRVTVSYRITGQRVTFDVGRYDHARTLVID